MKIYKNPKAEQLEALLKRPTQTVDAVEDLVNEVFGKVQQEGDTALMTYTSKFDGVDMLQIQVTAEEMRLAAGRVPRDLKAAMQLAKSNIETFHQAQQTSRVTVETMDGVACWQEKRPIQKVGLYIPGGTAPLFSSVLMLAVPAIIAGCQEIVLCSPPDEQGNLADEILYAAKLCGVSKVFKVGGIQAIAALTFGTQSVPQVYKIFGPGNQYVTVAKQLATKYGVSIDMPAGPSELLVMADETAKPNYVAADLLSQAEHGADSQVILVTTSETLAEAVSLELHSQLSSLNRKEIAEKAIANSRTIVVSDFNIALNIIDAYGPEHFIVVTKNDEFFINNISNAGSVFIGNYTPESAGDYASGTNHTLPTNGFSKAYSGVNLDSFLKSITFQKITQTGIKHIGKAIELMAEAEGLQAHKQAVTLRLKDLMP